MKYVIVFLLCLLSTQTILSEEIQKNQEGNNTLVKNNELLLRKPDSLLLVIQQNPSKEYKPTLEKFATTVFIENPNSKLQKLCLNTLMLYNDIWAYNCISYVIEYSKNYTSAAKCFCDAYDENKILLFRPLRQKYEIPNFISDSFVLTKTNLNDFVDKWLNYSSILMSKDKFNPLNNKIQEFYRWEEQRRYKEFLLYCIEKDSLCSLNKSKNNERIAILNDLIKRYKEAEANTKIILPRTIDVCYSSDSFAHYEEEYKQKPLFNEGCPRCRRDSQTVIVPYLKNFYKKEASNEKDEVHVFLMDTHIMNLIGNYACESNSNPKQISNLFNVDITFAENNMYVYPETHPTITNICSYSDGVLFNVRYINSGYWAFLPNDEKGEIMLLGHWVE